jgi:hypothetical protein
MLVSPVLFSGQPGVFDGLRARLPTLSIQTQVAADLPVAGLDGFPGHWLVSGKP